MYVKTIVALLGILFAFNDFTEAVPNPNVLNYDQLQNGAANYANYNHQPFVPHNPAAGYLDQSNPLIANQHYPNQYYNDQYNKPNYNGFNPNNGPPRIPYGGYEPASSEINNSPPNNENNSDTPKPHNLSELLRPAKNPNHSELQPKPLENSSAEQNGNYALPPVSGSASVSINSNAQNSAAVQPSNVENRGVSASSHVVPNNVNNQNNYQVQPPQPAGFTGFGASLQASLNLPNIDNILTNGNSQILKIENSSSQNMPNTASNVNVQNNYHVQSPPAGFTGIPKPLQMSSHIIKKDNVQVGNDANSVSTLSSNVNIGLSNFPNLPSQPSAEANLNNQQNSNLDSVQPKTDIGNQVIHNIDPIQPSLNLRIDANQPSVPSAQPTDAASSNQNQHNQASVHIASVNSQPKPYIPIEGYRQQLNGNAGIYLNYGQNGYINPPQNVYNQPQVPVYKNPYIYPQVNAAVNAAYNPSANYQYANRYPYYNNYAYPNNGYPYANGYPYKQPNVQKDEDKPLTQFVGDLGKDLKSGLEYTNQVFINGAKMVNRHLNEVVDFGTNVASDIALAIENADASAQPPHPKNGVQPHANANANAGVSFALPKVETGFNAQAQGGYYASPSNHVY